MKQYFYSPLSRMLGHPSKIAVIAFSLHYWSGHPQMFAKKKKTLLMVTVMVIVTVFRVQEGELSSLRLTSKMLD